MKKKKLFNILSIVLILMLFSLIIVSAYSSFQVNEKNKKKIKCEKFSYENCPDSCIRLKEPSCQVPCTVLPNGKIKCQKIPGCENGLRCVSPDSTNRLCVNLFSKNNINFSSK